MSENKKYERSKLMKTMVESDSFFKEYGILDDTIFNDNIIPKKYKELSMISISIVQKCKECIEYHIEETIKAEADKNEIIESIKIGMISSGSTSYPYVRFAFSILINKGIIKE